MLPNKTDGSIGSKRRFEGGIIKAAERRLQAYLKYECVRVCVCVCVFLCMCLREGGCRLNV